LTDYLTNEGPTSSVMDLNIDHERFGSSSDPSLIEHLHYPNDMDRSLHEADTDKIMKYHVDYNNNPPKAISFIHSITTTSGRLHSEFVSLFNLTGSSGKN
jgi:hypothetical protein